MVKIQKRLLKRQVEVSGEIDIMHRGPLLAGLENDYVFRLNSAEGFHKRQGLTASLAVPPRSTAFNPVLRTSTLTESPTTARKKWRPLDTHFDSSSAFD